MSSRLIAHQIIKEQHSVAAEISLRNELLPADTSIAESLMAQLRHAITQRNPQAGRFTSPAGEQPAFQLSLLRYLALRSDAEFVEFSHRITRYLRTQMEGQSLATGGYVVFAEHDHAGEKLLLLVLLSTHAQPWFDETMNLQAAYTLDFEHLRHGARIRYSGVKDNEDGVVHFVSRSGDGVSNYFQSFLGCEPLTDSAAQGRYLLTALRGMASELSLDKEELLQRAYSYWQDCRKHDRMMTMTSLANALVPTDPQSALLYLGNPSSQLAGEFSPPPAKVMKDYVKFEFNEAGLKLAFDREKWGDNVKTKDRTVIIRNAPMTLIEQINGDKE